MRQTLLTGISCLLLILTAAFAVPAALATDDQLTEIRNRIGHLENRLGRLNKETESVEREREKLDAELDLADARVHEVERLLTISGEESSRLRAEAKDLAAQIKERRGLLDRHLEVMALLGQPGPLQLFFDAYRGGALEDAIGTVSVLTAGQIRLFEEYREMSRQHALRLAELSKTLSLAKEDARTLELRRDELEGVRNRVALRLKELERSRNSADASLEDLREREAALERLVGVLASRQRFTGQEDIRGYRGALPWPVEGSVVQGFGRQRSPKYSTYRPRPRTRRLLAGRGAWYNPRACGSVRDDGNAPRPRVTAQRGR